MHQEQEQRSSFQSEKVAFVVLDALLHEVFLTLGIPGKFPVEGLETGKQIDQFLWVIPDHPVYIDQMLIGVIDHTLRSRIRLANSEEEGATAHERFNIGRRHPEVFGQQVDKSRQQASLASYPREARAARQRIRAFIFLVFHVNNN